MKLPAPCFRPPPNSTSCASNTPTSGVPSPLGICVARGTGEGWWIVDWPDAEDHFSSGVQRLTRVATGEPVHMRLTDDRIFDYPWIYATQAAGGT